MIALTVSRTLLGLPPLTAVDVTAPGATIRAWNPGQVVRETTLARSPDMGGGVATASRDDVVTMTLDLFLRGGSLRQSRVLADAWAAALGQLDFTIREVCDGATRTWLCLPTSVDIPPTPALWRGGIVQLTASIPRNPWYT